MSKRPTVVTLPSRSVGELASPDGSPYREARLVRRDLAGELRRALRRAQLVGGLLVVLAVILAVALHQQMGRAKIVPYVVEVDRHGGALAFGPAAELAAPDRRIILHTLGLWVRATRTVTLDKVLLRSRLGEAYALTGGRAVALLNEWYRRHPPFARAEEETVSVTEVDSVLALDGGEQSFRVQWTEEVRNPAGALLRREVWQALVEVEIDPPEVIEEVLANPLGIRVVDFDWQRLEEES